MTATFALLSRKYVHNEPGVGQYKVFHEFDVGKPCVVCNVSTGKTHSYDLIISTDDVSFRNGDVLKKYDVLAVADYGDLVYFEFTSGANKHIEESIQRLPAFQQRRARKAEADFYKGPVASVSRFLRRVSSNQHLING